MEALRRATCARQQTAVQARWRTLGSSAASSHGISTTSTRCYLVGGRTTSGAGRTRRNTWHGRSKRRVARADALASYQCRQSSAQSRLHGAKHWDDRERALYTTGEVREMMAAMCNLVLMEEPEESSRKKTEKVTKRATTTTTVTTRYLADLPRWSKCDALPDDPLPRAACLVTLCLFYLTYRCRGRSF